MKFVVGGRVFAMALMAMALSRFAAGADLVPWPWGAECPVAWSRLAGDWVARTHEKPAQFTIDLQGSWSNGTRVFEVRHYDGQNHLVGRGEGLAQRGERVLRAAMVGRGARQGRAYWAIIRTYEVNQKRSCARGQQVTVITLRAADGSTEEDVHVIVDKEDPQPPRNDLKE